MRLALVLAAAALVAAAPAADWTKRVTQTPQCFFFQLPNTFAAQAEFICDFFKCMGFSTAKSET